MAKSLWHNLGSECMGVYCAVLCLCKFADFPLQNFFLVGMLSLDQC